jgi:hypothetical protein
MQLGGIPLVGVGASVESSGKNRYVGFSPHLPVFEPNTSRIGFEKLRRLDPFYSGTLPAEETGEPTVKMIPVIS